MRLVRRRKQGRRAGRGPRGAPEGDISLAEHQEAFDALEAELRTKCTLDVPCAQALRGRILQAVDYYDNGAADETIPLLRFTPREGD